MGDEKIEITVESVVYQNQENGFRVIRGSRGQEKDVVTAVGKTPEVYEGQDLLLEGGWTRHERYGRQFRIEKCKIDPPTTEKGVKRYLASGLIKGIGEKYAEKIVDKFGEDTLEVIENDPENLLEISGIGDKKLEKIRESWKKQRQVKDVMVALKRHDISTAYGLKIYENYGAQASTVVEENPYRLSREIDGIGFKVADRIARKVGMKPEDSRRIKAGLTYTLEQASNDGHIYLPRKKLLEKSREFLEIPPDLIKEKIENMTSTGGLIEESNDGEKGTSRIYLPALYFMEEEVAEKLVALDRFGDGARIADEDRINELIDGYQITSGIDYNPEQREAIKAALQEKVTVVTGGPGTGKTTIVTGIIALMEDLGWEVILAAPTGRAAKRLEEMTGREAKTIHRTLGFKPPDEFEYNSENKLSTDAIIVDELSMVDLRLIDHLIQATPEGTNLVLVGDADQLPSVGPGDVMGDIIDSGAVGVVKLNQIYRQSGRSDIVTNAHRINEGEFPQIDGNHSDFLFVEEEVPRRASEKIIKLVAEEIPGEWDMEPMKDVQVLAPMYKGECGVDQLNTALQNELNPGDDLGFGSKEDFRIGDKVMQTENNYEKEVFNGDIGRIVGADRSDSRVEVDFPDYGIISYEKNEISALDLAYAITIHKSQGSEYDAVIIPLLNQHYVMLKRNLLYTAVTRSRELVILVGSKKALGMAVNNDRESRRFTTLSRRLKEKAGR
ncbi:ATP-dependent RecD-like DNA helicase [Candidatus Bipolaricaulota bacterium]|nr:ATP-dependent RecD-like DNA helicase [Candidatus Bipolaricaulota bacterium]